MNQASAYLADSTEAYSRVAFGSLFDLARLQSSAASAEICDACSTVNMGSSRVCKGCSHKLPACYSARGAAETVSPAEQPSGLGERTWELAAFWVVVNSLAAVTALPIS